MCLEKNRNWLINHNHGELVNYCILHIHVKKIVLENLKHQGIQTIIDLLDNVIPATLGTTILMNIMM